MKKFNKKILMYVLAAVLAFSGVYVAANVSAAGKKVIKLNKKSLTLKEGKTYKLKLLNIKKNAKVAWLSEKPEIAKVSKSGVVKGVKKGSTTIYARYNKVLYQCSVKVLVGPKPIPTPTPTPEIPQYTESPEKTPIPTLSPIRKPVNVPDNTLGSGDRMVRIGMSETEVISKLGSPVRKDASPFGFESYIYKNSDGSDYLLVDIKGGKVVNACGISDRIAYGKEVTGETTSSMLASDASWSSYGWYDATDDLENKLGKGAYYKKTGGVTILAFVDFFADERKVYCIQAFSSAYSLEDMTKPSLTKCSNNKQILDGISSEIFDMTNAYRATYGESALKKLDRLEACAAPYCKSLAASATNSPKGRAGEELFNAMYYENNLDPLYIGENAYYGCPDAIGFANCLILQEGSRKHMLGIFDSDTGVEQDKVAYTGIACSYINSGRIYKVYVIQDFCSADY